VPALLALPWVCTHAWTWPALPIRYIVPVTGGGGGDLVVGTVTECRTSIVRDRTIEFDT